MTQDEQNFIDAVAPAARLSHQQYGIPASITIAQAQLESAWGRSALARLANNYFGVKAVQGQDYADFRTTEYFNGKKEVILAHFAKYHSVAESFVAHAKLLATLSRYAPAMAVASDPRAFAVAIKTCGYSTASNYPQELMTLVNEFNLTQFDAVICPDFATPGK